MVKPQPKYFVTLRHHVIRWYVSKPLPDQIYVLLSKRYPERASEHFNESARSNYLENLFEMKSSTWQLFAVTPHFIEWGFFHWRSSFCSGYGQHCIDVIMTRMASQITSLTIVYSTVYSGADKKKTSKLRVTGLCVGNSPGPVNSPHKGPVTRKMIPFDDVIMSNHIPYFCVWCNHSLLHHWPFHN